MSEQNFENFLTEFQALTARKIPFVVATLVHVQGEAPQNTGARIVVGENEILFGTIGGGKLENRVLQEARAHLSGAGGGKNFFREWNLQKDLGMTCGGVVRIFFESFRPQTRWRVAVFGAGHVSQALCRLLATLDCDVDCFDSRAEWIAKLPAAPRLKARAAADLTAALRELPDAASVVLVTMGHGTDLPLLLTALREKNFAYLGVMGSDIKAKRLRADVLAAGLTEKDTARFFSPIGEELGNNSPAEIAVSIAAQLLKVRDSRA